MMIVTARNQLLRTIPGSLAAIAAFLIVPGTPSPLHAQSVPRQPASQQPQLHAADVRHGRLAADAKLPPWPTVFNPLDSITPVTDSMLNHSPAGEWLTWRRTYDDMGFSPLRQITTVNVKDLRVAWSLTLPAGPNEATPLVHDGVLFVHSFGDNVQALDAATGDELWHYARKLPEGTHPSVKRNMALYGDKIYVGTSDAHVVALEVKTGNVVWDRAITSGGGTLTGGPLVAKGKLMQGIGGGRPGGAYISALNAETGEDGWRFYSIARPDQLGGNSWNDVPLEKRSGGSVWTAGSYDPDLNLVFFGPGNTYDTGPLRNPVVRAGVTNDALFTNTTVAINPDNGKLVWFYQHMPNDQWDMDWGFERQIVSLRGANGQTRKLVVTASKAGIYDAVEAESGKYAFSFDMGLQNFITSIDSVTGAKTFDQNLIPGAGKPVMICPHAGGGRNWIPGAYNPDSRVLYVPANETCMNLNPVTPGEDPYFSTGVVVRLRPRPGSDGRYGRLQAINLDTKKTIWTERQRAPQTTGVLATGGGLVFAGALDRWLTAYDDASGRVLWRVRLNDVPNSAPITYMANGNQYLAIVVGYGGAQAMSFPQLTPEIPLPVVRSSAIWVFELR